MPIDPSLLPAMVWFTHIARHRSFTKAAAEMNVTRAALSQHLKTLEQQLGVRLLHRTAYSGAIRTPIPALPGQSFRDKPDTDSAINQPF